MGAQTPELGDTRGDAAWTDPTRPPTWGNGLTRNGDRVWSTWLDDDPDHPYVWHWCDRSVQNAQPGVTNPRAPGWSLAGTGAHALLSREPLTLDPSLHLPDCCGLHGFLREGRWTDCG